jgi:hypothetical protein
MRTGVVFVVAWALMGVVFAPAAQAAAAPVVVPAGTKVPLAFTTTIAPDKVQEGRNVRFRVAADGTLVRGGHVTVPAGAATVAAARVQAR